MKKIWCGVFVLIGVIGISIVAAAAEVFINNLGQPARGLVLTFTQPVEVIEFGGAFTIQQPAGKASTFSFSGNAAQKHDSFWLSWTPASATVADHVWLSTEPADWRLLDHAMAKGVNEDTYAATMRTKEFLTTDHAAYSWIEIGPIYGTHTGVWEWFAPDGTIYRQQETAEIGRVGEAHDWWRHYAWISIDGKPPATMPGKWRVACCLDGEPLITEDFLIFTPKVSVQTSVILENEATDGVIIVFKEGDVLLDVLSREVENSYVIPTGAQDGVHQAILEIETGRWQVLAMKPTGEDNEYWISDVKTLTFFQGFTYTVELFLSAKARLSG